MSELKKTGLSKPRMTNDAWANTIAGLSGTGDKFRNGNTVFEEYPWLEDEELTNIWMGEGLGKRIVSSVADDMTRNWFDIEGDENGKIQDELTRLEAKNKINQAVKWARLYRGSIILLGFKDGLDLEHPRGATTKQIDWMKVYPASRVPVTTTDIVSDPKSPYFEDVEVYKIYTLSGSIIRAHASRCLVFKGDPVPESSGNIEFKYRYWGMSALQPAWERLSRFAAVEQGISNLLMEFVIGVFKLSGLAEMLAEDGDGSKKVYTRMEIINASKSLINSVLLGEDEEFSRNTANVGGMADLWDRMMMMLSAVTEIPVTRLFGRSPAGQNSTGESDLRNYYDSVKAKQETWLNPPVQDLINWINGYLKQTSTPAVKWKSVWELTETEKLANQKTQAETDKMYYDMGVLSEQEIRQHRFVDGNTGPIVVEDDETLPAPETPPGKEV